MKEERMKILQMIEDGKISAAEGADLISVLKGSETAKDKLNKAAKATGDFICSTKNKICEYAKEKEPAVKEKVENLAEMAGEFADGVGKTIKSFVEGSDTINEPEKQAEEATDNDKDIIDI